MCIFMQCTEEPYDCWSSENGQEALLMAGLCMHCINVYIVAEKYTLVFSIVHRKDPFVQIGVYASFNILQPV